MISPLFFLLVVSQILALFLCTQCQNLTLQTPFLNAEFVKNGPSTQLTFVNSSSEVWWANLNLLYVAEKDDQGNWVTYWDLGTKPFDQRLGNDSALCGPAADWVAQHNSSLCLRYATLLPNNASVEVVFVATARSNALVAPCGLNGSVANLTSGGYLLAANISAWPFVNTSNLLELGLSASGSFDGLDVGVADYDSGTIEEVSAPSPFSMGLYVHFWECVQSVQPNGSSTTMPLTIGTKVKKVFAPASVELHLRVPAFTNWMALLGPAVFVGKVVPVRNFWGWYVLAFALGLLLCCVFGVLLYFAHRHYSSMESEETASLRNQPRSNTFVDANQDA